MELNIGGLFYLISWELKYSFIKFLLGDLFWN